MLLGGKKKSGHVHWYILQLKDHFANMGIHYNRFSIRSIKKKGKEKEKKNKQTNKEDQPWKVERVTTRRGKKKGKKREG